MGMMQNIINDAKAMEAETIRAEEGSQKACEDFVRGWVRKEHKSNTIGQSWLCMLYAPKSGLNLT